MSSAPAHAQARPLPGGEPPRLAVLTRPRREIGEVILRPDDPRLIAGIEIEVAAVWPDDRGFFTELFRFGNPGFVRGFTPTVQVSAALSYPGTIKAIHFHRRQTDLWAPVRGQLQIVLVDLRVESASFGQVNTLYAGELRPWRIRIPPGIGHGYKVVGLESALMVYATDRYYDPADEGRIPYNDAGLNYDWELQHK